MNTAPGDDGLTLSGEMVLSYPFEPAIDPLMNGVRLAIYRSFPNGAVLEDAIIPSGAYDTVTKKGWKVNGPGTTWTYVNTPNDLPSKINKVQVKVDTHNLGLVKFSAKGKAGAFGVALGQIPVTMEFSLESGAALNGQCAVERFPGPFRVNPLCFFNAPVSTLNCR